MCGTHCVLINFYARKQLLLSSRLSHRNSVCLSVTQVDQSKTVQGRITKSLPLAARKTLVSGTVKLFHEFERGSPRTRVLNERWVGKICDFWPISRCISVTVLFSFDLILFGGMAFAFNILGGTASRPRFPSTTLIFGDLFCTCNQKP